MALENKVLRGVLLAGAVVASLATSSIPRPANTYQIDLLTRDFAAYELTAQGTAEGGFDEVAFQVSVEWSRREAPTGEDGVEASFIRVARMERRPSLAEMEAFREGVLPEGALLLGEAPAENIFFNQQIPARAEPSWILFVRRGPPEVLVASLFPPCEEYCGALLLEDVTLKVEQEESK